MNLIIDHLEYLMQRHDCVTLPGIGALIARNIPARFSSDDNCRLLPPSRILAFNGALTQSDGLLENSVSRKAGISFEAARRVVDDEMDSLRNQLLEFGQLTIGRLGSFSCDADQNISFEPYPTSEWDFRYYGLKPLQLAELQEATESESAVQIAPQKRKLPAVTPYDPYKEEAETTGGTIMRKIIGVAASLAVIVTITLFLLNPIHVENAPARASMAPTEKVIEAKTAIDAPMTAPTKVASSPTDANANEAAETNDLNSANAKDASTVPDPKDDPKAEATKALKSIPEGMQKAQEGRYCVVVASFPDINQANRYISQNSSRRLNVLHKDGKYRVYAASAATPAEAEMLKRKIGQQDAWVCAR